MANFVLTTVGTVGDIVPFILLGQALKRRDHQVTLITHCGYKSECKDVGLNFVALDTPSEFERFIQDGHLLNSGAGIPEFLRRHVVSSVLSHSEIIQAHCTPETIMVARSAPSIASRLVAEKMHLPFVSILIAPHHITATAVVVTLLDSVFSAEINEIRAGVGLPRVSDWRIWWQMATLNVGLWPAWFSPLPPSAPAHMLLTGFFWRRTDQQANLPGEFKQIMAGSESPILITGGTGVFGGKEFYTVSAEACKYLGRQAILLNRFPELMPDRLPSNVHWFEYIDSLGNTMPQMAAVIHHGGVITLSQALSAGIPQAILAFGGDRPENALCAQRLGVAKYLPRQLWDAETVAKELEHLMASDTVQAHCRQTAEWFAQTDSVAMACDALEAVAANGRTYPGAAFHRVTGETETQLPIEQEERCMPHIPAIVANLTSQQQAFLAARLRQKSKLERN